MFTADFFFGYVFDNSKNDWRSEWNRLRGRPNLRFLEIGVFEGAATLYFFKHFLGASGSIVCIDPFLPYSVSTVEKMAGIDHLINESTRDRFVENTKGYADRITLLHEFSQKALPGLPSGEFDLIVIDGDHSQETVATDAAQSFRLAKSGGYLVFDDYDWKTTRAAIDGFLSDHAGRVQILDIGRCAVVKKL
jgi:predicted O-methyltransferase YrrM